ncbi:MAG: hypothetical protein HGA96_13780 [Desulfobulbaceae bacterium]|nr:hypothetical protein [Desulfobulbaceae bacterium]
MSRLTLAIILLLILGTAPACTQFRPQSPPPDKADSATADSAETEQAAAAPVLPRPESATIHTGELLAEAIPDEISRLEAIARDHLASAAARSEGLRRLALLHLSPQNPARDLELAAAAQAAYLETLAPGVLRQEGEIWLDLIKAAQEGERLLRQQAAGNREKEKTLAALGAEKQRLLQKITALEASNTKLKGDIEKLKFIDLSMEKKRQSFR